MIAVCSYARTFKEAQNYITPVILAALIPGGIAACDQRAEGRPAVMPVANMVLLTRELLAAGPCRWARCLVLASTTLYAAAAVAVRPRVGAESVVFADSGSLRATFQRRMFQRTAQPPRRWCPGRGGPVSDLVLHPGVLPVGRCDLVRAGARMSSMAMPVCFLVVPLLVLACGRWTFSTRSAGASVGRYLAAGALLDLACDTRDGTGYAPDPRASRFRVRAAGERNARGGAAGDALWQVLLCLGLVPAVCEEVIFRGFLLSALRGAVRNGSRDCGQPACSPCFTSTSSSCRDGCPGVVLAGSAGSPGRSAGVLAHGLHNSLSAAITVAPSLAAWLRINTSDPPLTCRFR